MHERVANRTARCSLEVSHATIFRIRTPSDHDFGACTGPFHGPQRIHFGVHILHGSEPCIGQHYHHMLQHQRTLKEKLEKSKLTPIPSEIMENQQLDARADAFYGTRLIPELEVVLARGLTSFSRLEK